MTLKNAALTFLLAFVLGLVAVDIASAQAVTPSDDEVNAIARQLYCPVCENIPLDVCPTTACAQWRELIRLKLSDGWTEQQIKDYFVQQYGARVLGTPPARGINWLVYIVPPVAILAGIYVLIRAFRSWKRPSGQDDFPLPAPETSPGKDSSQDDYIHRLEDEVRKR
jgi:cytochrome c-type biogenesis protein CcmH